MGAAPDVAMNKLTTITDQLTHVTGGSTDFPGMHGCGPSFFSRGCQDGGMNLNDWFAVTTHSKFEDGPFKGQPATFSKWKTNMKRLNPGSPLF
jgi:hypothetical protein